MFQSCATRHQEAQEFASVPVVGLVSVLSAGAAARAHLQKTGFGGEGVAFSRRPQDAPGGPDSAPRPRNQAWQWPPDPPPPPPGPKPSGAAQPASPAMSVASSQDNASSCGSGSVWPSLNQRAARSWAHYLADNASNTSTRAHGLEDLGDPEMSQVSLGENFFMSVRYAPEFVPRGPAGYPEDQGKGRGGPG